MVHAIAGHFHRHKPDADKDRTVEEIADQIDWLEYKIETYGTVVPKQPDVWGEARLTRHRHEFEREMFNEFGNFTATLQAAIRRTDQAYFGAALAISGNQQGEPQSNSSSSSAISMIGDPNAPGQEIIDRRGPERIDLKNFQTKEMSLEPTVVLDQKARYLNHLNEIRRINEGDDITDSPGYALNLVRIPISVLPGKRTREGYGAELTITADLYLTDDLLPDTFRNLIVEDVVDQLALPITKVVENEQIVEQLASFLIQVDKNVECDEQQFWWSQFEGRSEFTPQERGSNHTETDALSVLNNSYKELKEAYEQSIDVPGRQPMRYRRTPLAYPSSQIDDVFGKEFHVLGHVVLDAARSLDHRASNYPASSQRRVVHLMDVQSFLRTELESAYQFLKAQGSFLMASHCTPELVLAIRERQRKVEWNNKGFDNDLTSNGIKSIIDLRDEYFNDIKRRFPRAAHSTTVSLAWAIIVESALLNDRLMKDMREVATGKGCDCYVEEGQWADFYMPQPSATAIETFNEYVRCRWPIHVFAMEPITQDQNVAEIFNRRRELQLAISVAVANGKMSANAASQFARRLETDIETISLNRTAVAFSHGADTFGWRFYPRVQAPPTPSTLGAFGQTLFGGPSADADLRRRQLEPAIRECHALVVMPSFVPQLTFDTRANWFDLTNPRNKVLTMNDTMKLSRSYQAIQTGMQTVCHSNNYRPGDVSQLQRVVGHLDRRMPLQNMLVEIPYENTSGGFELFSNGVTDLAPELVGWYGAPGVAVGGETCNCQAGTSALVGFNRVQCPLPCAGTTLFLVGDGFSVHDTRVIVGGKCVPYILLSRQVMEVTVPPHVNVVVEDGFSFVDAHVATPYGISSHVLIPAVMASPPPPPLTAELAQRLAPMTFQVSTERLRFTFTYDRASGRLQDLTLHGADTQGTVDIAYKQGAQLPLDERSGLDVLMAIDNGGKMLGKARKIPRGKLDTKSGQIVISAEAVRAALELLLTDPPLNELTNLYANGNQQVLEFQAVFFVEPFQRDDDQRSISALPVQADGRLVLELHKQQPDSPVPNNGERDSSKAKDPGATREELSEPASTPQPMNGAAAPSPSRR